MWLGEPIRPTKDVDLLGFGDTSAEALKRVFMQLCAIESPDDGLRFLPDSVHVEAIREDQEYGGMRVRLMAMLGKAIHERQEATLRRVRLLLVRRPRHGR
jgi:hypothetical protein